MNRSAVVGSVSGPTTALRFMNYAGGGPDTLPDDLESWTGLAGRLEALLLEEPALRDDLDVGTLAHARLTVVHPGDLFPDIASTRAYFTDRFNQAAAGDPALSGCRLRVTGTALLQATIPHDLLPTL